MKAKMEQFPAINPNPVLSVEKDGTVLYSNKAGEPLLHEWGVEIGGKLPSSIGDLVQRVISRNSPEKMEVKVGNRVYLVVFHPLPEQECVNIYGFDISDQKELEERLLIKEKQNDILYKIGKIALEYDSLQNFMDESVKLIASILEVEYCKIMELLPDGNFLLRAGIGWKSGLSGNILSEGKKSPRQGIPYFQGCLWSWRILKKKIALRKPEILGMHDVASGVSVIIGSMEKSLEYLLSIPRKKGSLHQTTLTFSIQWPF